jgi:hypothetical protein
MLLAIVSLVSSAPAHAAESIMGALHGTVSAAGHDGQGHSAPGAKVRLSGMSQNGSMSVVANDSGEYKFGSVTPGSYTLEVTLDGFEQVTRPVAIHAGETTIENVKLEAKSVRAEVIVQADRVGLNMSDAEPASEREQKARVLTNLHTPEYGKLISSLAASHFIKSGVSYNAFNENASRHFAPTRNETVHFARIFSLEMEVLKSLRLRVSPKLIRPRNHFYPRDLQGNPGSPNFGTLPNDVGRMFGLRFVLEKK